MKPDYIDATYDMFLGSIAGEQSESIRFNEWLEAVEQDAAPLWQHLGFRLDLPHSNPSKRDGDYRGYYSDGDAELLESLCAEDIARFKYRF